MKTAEKISLAGVFATLCVSGFGQNRPPRATDDSDVRIVSSFVAAGEPVPETCRQEAHTFAQSLVRYPRPASWHWVLVCDEAGWRRFLRMSGRAEQAEIYASTDLERRTTYLRGAKLLFPFDLQASPDGIVAHELGHIQLHTESEEQVDRLIRLWREVLPNSTHWARLPAAEAPEAARRWIR